MFGRMSRMDRMIDLEEEARAADALAESLTKVDAPQELIAQAREQAKELRSAAGSRSRVLSGSGNTD